MYLFSLQTCLCSIALLSIPIYLYISRHHRRRNPSKKPPFAGTGAYPLLGILPQYLSNRHRFLEWLTELILASATHTINFSIPFYTRVVITANPLNVEHVVRTRFESYPQGERLHFPLRDLLGDGIFNVDGEHWKAQRKMASFEFNKRSLRSFVVESVRFETVHRLLPLLRRSAQRDEAVDLQDVLDRFGFDNICRVAFGVDPASLSDGAPNPDMPPDFMKAFDDASKYSMERFYYAVENSWRIKRFLDVGSERRLREAIKTVHDFALQIVRSRKNDPSARSDDLLSRFSSYDESTEEFLRDITVSFLVAGRETTSSALTWLFWILSSRPDVQSKILEEIEATRRTSDAGSEETLGLEELRGMHYLHAAVTEALRLYPPVPLDAQTCGADDVLPDGTCVKKGWTVMYSAYVMGRSEEIWGEDCCEYRPERWLVEGEFRPESPYRLPVFHAGPRMCLGKEMAYIQMKSVAASVVERFAVEALDGKEPEFLMSLSLRMKGGLVVRLRERGDAPFAA